MFAVCRRSRDHAWAIIGRGIMITPIMLADHSYTVAAMAMKTDLTRGETVNSAVSRKHQKVIQRYISTIYMPLIWSFGVQRIDLNITPLTPNGN